MRAVKLIAILAMGSVVLAASAPGFAQAAPPSKDAGAPSL